MLSVGEVLYDEFRDAGVRAAAARAPHGPGRLPRPQDRQGLLRLLEVVAPCKAIDLHVHLPTEEWLQNAIGPHLEATEAYFRNAPPRKSIEEVAAEYAERDILGVVLDWDDESVTGRGWLGNEYLAGLSETVPGRADGVRLGRPPRARRRRPGASPRPTSG